MSDQWYHSKAGKAEGPLTEKAVKQGVRSGKWSGFDLFYCVGHSTWRKLCEIEEFKGVVAKSAIVQPEDGAKEPDPLWVLLIRRKGGKGARAFKQTGPYLTSVIQTKLKTGSAKYNDYVWREGMEAWGKISELAIFNPRSHSPWEGLGSTEVAKQPDDMSEVTEKTIIEQIQKKSPEELLKNVVYKVEPSPERSTATEVSFRLDTTSSPPQISESDKAAKLPKPKPKGAKKPDKSSKVQGSVPQKKHDSPASHENLAATERDDLLADAPDDWDLQTGEFNEWNKNWSEKEDHKNKDDKASEVSDEGHKTQKHRAGTALIKGHAAKVHEPRLEKIQQRGEAGDQINGEQDALDQNKVDSKPNLESADALDEDSLASDKTGLPALEEGDLEGVSLEDEAWDQNMVASVDSPQGDESQVNPDFILQYRDGKLVPSVKPLPENRKRVDRRHGQKRGRERRSLAPPHRRPTNFKERWIIFKDLFWFYLFGKNSLIILFLLFAGFGLYIIADGGFQKIGRQLAKKIGASTGISYISEWGEGEARSKKGSGRLGGGKGSLSENKSKNIGRSAKTKSLGEQNRIGKKGQSEKGSAVTELKPPGLDTTKLPLKLSLKAKGLQGDDPLLEVRAQGGARRDLVKITVIGLAGQVTGHRSYYKTIKLAPKRYAEKGAPMVKLRFKGRLNLKEGNYFVAVEYGKLKRSERYFLGKKSNDFYRRRALQRKRVSHYHFKERHALWNQVSILNRLLSEWMKKVGKTKSDSFLAYHRGWKRKLRAAKGSQLRRIGPISASQFIHPAQWMQLKANWKDIEGELDKFDGKKPGRLKAKIKGYLNKNRRLKTKFAKLSLF